MGHTLNEDLGKQFGASIDMLENAISLCPAGYWDTAKRFWYNAYDCLFFLDYYLTMDQRIFHLLRRSPFQNLRM